MSYYLHKMKAQAGDTTFELHDESIFHVVKYIYES